MSPQLTKPRHWLFALTGGLAAAAVSLGLAIAMSPDGAGEAARNGSSQLPPGVLGHTNGTGETDDDGASTPPNFYLICWGDTSLMTSAESDECFSPYTPVPEWALGSYRNGGRWIRFASDNPRTNVPAWQVGRRETNSASLNLDIDRQALDDVLADDQALFFGVSFLDYADRSAALRVSLLSTNGETVLKSNDNLIQGSGQAVAVVLQLPLQPYPEAACVHLESAGGPATVFESILYTGEADRQTRHIVEIGRWSTTGYIFDHGGNTNDYGGGGGTNRPHPWPTPGPTNAPPTPTPSPSTNAPPAKVYSVYIDQLRGDDSYAGCSPALSKKTLRAGMAAIRPETRKLILNEGTYRGDVKSLNLRGKPIRLEIRGGRVRL